MSTNPRNDTDIKMTREKHQSRKRKKLGVLFRKTNKNILTFLSLLNLNWVNIIMKGLQFGTVPAKDGSSPCLWL